MKKIISLFKRDYEGTRLIYDEVVEGAEWVIEGEGLATEKYDGMACMVQDGQLYKRYDAKHGKTPPIGFIPAQDPDPVTGHYPGWILVDYDLPENKWFRDVMVYVPHLFDGTYELIGEKIQGNPYRMEGHQLFKHGARILSGVPRDFKGLQKYFKTAHVEGIVWHHADGCMVKIKAKDFGIDWTIQNEGIKHE